MPFLPAVDFFPFADLAAFFPFCFLPAAAFLPPDFLFLPDWPAFLAPLPGGLLVAATTGALPTGSADLPAGSADFPAAATGPGSLLDLSTAERSEKLSSYP